MVKFLKEIQNKIPYLYQKIFMKKFVNLTIIASLVIIHSITAQTKANQYNLANKFSIEGDGGWDYLTVDENSGKLYISHGTIVQVMDTKNGQIIGNIKDLKGVHGIALAENLNKGFITSGRDSSVVVFDLNTSATIEKISIHGQNPDAILYDNFTQRIFTFNGRSNDATVIDAKTNKTIGTIILGSKPEFAVTNGKGKIYVNMEDTCMVFMINPATMKVEQQWTLKRGKEPSGLAIDKVNNRLFSVCDNKLMIVMDAETGKVIASLPIGEHVDGCGFDAELKRAYSSNGDGTLTVIQEVDANTFKVLENVNTQKGARTISVNSKTHHIFLPTAEYGETPKPTNENPRPRPSVKPNSFVILDVAPVK